MNKNKAKLNLNASIHRLITVGEFLSHVKGSAWAIFYNYDVRRAVEILQRLCRDGKPREVRGAKGVLTEAGLSAFIPKEALHRQTAYSIRYWKKNSWTMKGLIDDYKDALQPFFSKKRYTKTEKTEIMKRCFIHFFGKNRLEKEFNELIKGERSKDLRHIAISFFAFEHGLLDDFESLKKIYYKTCRERKNRKGVKISELMKTVPAPENMGVDDTRYYQYILRNNL